LPPVVFIPGDGGNMMEAKININPNMKSDDCPTQRDWFRIWLSLRVSRKNMLQKS